MKTYSDFLRVGSTVSLSIAVLLQTGCAQIPLDKLPSLARQDSQNPEGASQMAPSETVAPEPKPINCSTMARDIGIAVGAFGGAVVGKFFAEDKNKNLAMAGGAVLGAAIGGLIGHDIDRRKCELLKIAEQNKTQVVFEDIKLPVEVAPATAVEETRSDTPGRTASEQPSQPPKVAVRGSTAAFIDSVEQFAVGSAVPTDAGRKMFEQVAKHYLIKLEPTMDPKTRDAVAARNKTIQIVLIGHTDDVGDSRFNADLSQARARAIAKIFEQNGLPSANVFYQGAGEVYPIADNRTADGRRMNRRVEIVDLQDESALNDYLASRVARTEFYRTERDEQPARSKPVPAIASVQGGAVDTTKSKPMQATPVPTTVDAQPSAKNGVPAGAQGQPISSGGSTAPGVKGQAANPGAPAAPNMQGTQAASAGVTSAGVQQQMRVKPGSQVVSPAPRQNGGPSTAKGWIDFGGRAVDADKPLVDIGPLTSTKSFSFISTANASEPGMPVANCSADRPRVSHGVKSIANDGEVQYRTKDFVRGMYGVSWSGSVNKHLVAINHVSVLRDNAMPTTKPEVLVYKNYRPGSNSKPDIRSPGDVNVYRGERGLLYRVFLSGAVECIDLVVPHNGIEARDSVLLYKRGGDVYAAQYPAALIGSK